MLNPSKIFKNSSWFKKSDNILLAKPQVQESELEDFDFLRKPQELHPLTNQSYTAAFYLILLQIGIMGSQISGLFLNHPFIFESIHSFYNVISGINKTGMVLSAITILATAYNMSNPLSRKKWNRNVKYTIAAGCLFFMFSLLDNMIHVSSTTILEAPMVEVVSDKYK